MKKVYRALSEGACEKKFIGNEAAVPDGWFESPAEALGAYDEPAEPAEPVKRGPGRPKKEDSRADNS